jgi:cell division protein FtsB
VRRPERASRAAPATSRTERRRAARVRRNRVVLVVATLSSAGILAAWFPASALLHQRAQLGAASAQLGRLNRENAALRHREHQLRTPATLGRIAQQQYDLVPPGDQAYQVLPPSGSGTSGGSLAATATGTSASGAGTSTPGRHDVTGAGTSGAGTSGASGGFFARILRTLEFWR